MITVLRVDEDGHPEAEFSDSPIDELLASLAPDSGCCLRFIDPYGDTTFNCLQLPVLAEELRAAAKSMPALSQRIDALAEFVESAAAMTHSYIKFVGD
jgi:hypothetical protein